MIKRGDGIECETCNNELWVCEEHGELCCDDRSTPCHCNDGLSRGWPDFDVADAVASETPIIVDPMKRAH